MASIWWLSRELVKAVSRQHSRCMVSYAAVFSAVCAWEHEHKRALFEEVRCPTFFPLWTNEVQRCPRKAP